jgi:hypothetical protein
MPQTGENEMIVTVTIQTEGGSRSYTGHIVSRGPSTMEMLLTEPFPMAGRCVQFPSSQIMSEQTHAGHVRAAVGGT